MVSVVRKRSGEFLFLKLKKKIDRIPKSPGVYLIKSFSNHIIYIGKAKDLRKRTGFYVQVLGGLLKRIKSQSIFSIESNIESIKTEVLAQKMSDIDFIATSSEVEAFLLEAKLIKKHKPRYNVRLKDDKAYPYLYLNVGKEFPRIELSRRVKFEEEALYFGPYTQASVLRELVDFLNKTFLIRDCSDHFMKSRKKPCLTHQMGFCEAPCVGWVSKLNYKKNIRRALNFLLGKNKSLRRKLSLEMKKASQSEEFEKAARIRDRLKSLEILSNTQQKLTLSQSKDQDVIFILDKGEPGILIQFLYIRNSYVTGRNSHFIPFSYFQLAFRKEFPRWFEMQLSLGDLNKNLIQKKRTQSLKEGLFLASPKLKQPVDERKFSMAEKNLVERNESVLTYLIQYYEENVIPERILISSFFDQTHENFLKSFLKQRKKKNFSFISPISKFFTKEDQNIMKTVHLEAENAFKKWNRKFHSHLMALKQLRTFFRLSRVPYRIEAFDVSHFSGSSPVASCVVFENGDFKSSEYRHYKLKLDSKGDEVKMDLRKNFSLQKKWGVKKVKGQIQLGQDDFSSMREVLKRRFKNKAFNLPDLILIDGGRGQLNQALQVLKEEGLDQRVFALGMAKARVTKNFKSLHVHSSRERFYAPRRKNVIFLPEDSKALHLLVTLRDEAHRFALRLQKKQRQKQFKGH